MAIAYEGEAAKEHLLTANDAGAVIFGHNADIQCIWKDIGDPDKGELPLSGEESDHGAADSAIGLSVRLPAEPEPQGYSPTSSSSGIHALQHEHYRIGMICAWSEESKTLRTLLDSHHQDLPKRHKDMNT